MKHTVMHKSLERLIQKFIPADRHEDSVFVDFVKAVNQFYINSEKEKELYEHSTQLNDKEYFRITQKLKSEIEEKNQFQTKLVDAILKLNDNSTHTETLNNDLNPIELLDILNSQIDVRKKIEEELLISKNAAENANKAKSEFLSMMSHEIRTPLNAIIGLNYIMEKEDTLEGYRENLKTLNLSANNLNLLINDILDLNKIELGKIDLELIPINIIQIVSDIKKTLEARAAEKQNRISLMIDDDLSKNLLGDPLRISQILTNLLSNAVKFTEKGLISILIEMLYKDDEICEFKISIKDTGIGIQKEKFDLIFEKFTQADNQTTRKYGGSGLGLVITKKLLHLMHSDLHLESEFGKGSTFSFILKLPISHQSIDIKNDNLTSLQIENENLNGIRILLVEDFKINVIVALKILGTWNVTIDTAENGQIALDMFQKNTYDIVLMDIQMPIMDGYECSLAIRKFNTTTPIIALTASASAGNQEKAMEYGMNDYVTKPFNPKELYLKIKKYTQKTK